MTQVVEDAIAKRHQKLFTRVTTPVTQGNQFPAAGDLIVFSLLCGLTYEVESLSCL